MKYCYNRFLGLPKSSTISGTTRAPIFYKIYEPITSYMWDEFFPSPVYMRFQRDLISFMEIHEIGLHITIPSFILYISPSKSVDFTVFSTKIQKVCHHFVTKLFSSHGKIPVFTVLSVFSKIGDALVKTFCILPHFYLFLYPG